MLLHNRLHDGGQGPAEIKQRPECESPRPQHGSPRSPSLRSISLLPRPLARLPKPPLLPIRYGTPPGFKADSSGKAGEMGSVGSEGACPLSLLPPPAFLFFSAPHKKYLSQRGFLRAPRAAGRRMHGGTEESPGRGQGRPRRVCQHRLALPSAPLHLQ